LTNSKVARLSEFVFLRCIVFLVCFLYKDTGISSFQAINKQRLRYNDGQYSFKTYWAPTSQGTLKEHVKICLIRKPISSFVDLARLPSKITTFVDILLNENRFK
jgi:hypothetical protein